MLRAAGSLRRAEIPGLLWGYRSADEKPIAVGRLSAFCDGGFSDMYILS